LTAHAGGTSLARVGYVERHLLPEERIAYKTRLHWILFIKPALLTVFGVALATVLSWVPDPPWLWYAGIGIAVLGVLWWLVRWIEVMTSEFAVTSMRLIFKVGLVARYTAELLLNKVESISVTQSLLGRVLNYGDLVVTGTGGAREVFARVSDPVGFRNEVQRASSVRPGA
jgi:uncharacterized membrane protein YdbT with pleckstrin-like domain